MHTEVWILGNISRTNHWGTTLFEEIVVTYPVPGHSFMPIDQAFGLIEKKRLKMEKVTRPEDWLHVIHTARPSNFKTVSKAPTSRRHCRNSKLDRTYQKSRTYGVSLSPCPVTFSWGSIKEFSATRHFHRHIYSKLLQSENGRMKDRVNRILRETHWHIWRQRCGALNLTTRQ